MIQKNVNSSNRPLNIVISKQPYKILDFRCLQFCNIAQVEF
jgi:hypothetical protein